MRQKIFELRMTPGETAVGEIQDTIPVTGGCRTRRLSCGFRVLIKEG